MEIITNEQYQKLLPSDVGGRAFLFYGEEDYLKAAAVRATTAALCPDESMAFFNSVKICFEDYTAEKLLDAMSAPPMMTDSKLVVLSGFNFNGMRADVFSSVVAPLGALAEYDYCTVLITVPAEMIDEGYSAKKPSPVLKKLAEVATPVKFETPTGARLVRWVGKHFAHHGVLADSAVCTALIDCVGGTMCTLANEIDKLSCFVKAKGASAVTAADIAAVSSKMEGMDTFALSNAILAGNSQKALDVLSVLRFERVEPVIVLAELARIFDDLQATHVLLAAGKSNKEIATLLRLHQFRADLLVRAAARLDTARLARVSELAFRVDFLLKNVKDMPKDYTLVEKLVCAI